MWLAQSFNQGTHAMVPKWLHGVPCAFLILQKKLQEMTAQRTSLEADITDYEEQVRGHYDWPTLLQLSGSTPPRFGGTAQHAWHRRSYIVAQPCVAYLCLTTPHVSRSVLCVDWHAWGFLVSVCVCVCVCLHKGSSCEQGC